MKISYSAKHLEGLLPPLMLPLNDSAEIDFESLRREIDYLAAGKVNGIWLNGSTGDFHALSDVECAEVVKVSVNHVAGRFPVVAQVGDASTRGTILKAEQALAAGADFLAVVVPFYLDYSQAELKAHFRAVSKAAGRPVILYNVPQLTKTSASTETVLELAREGVLIGIKESSGNLDQFRQLIARVREEGLDLRCLNGSSVLADLSLFVGGHGLVCSVANLAPHTCKQICDLAANQNWSAVNGVAAKLGQLLEAMKLPNRPGFPPTIAVYKWIFREIGIFTSDTVFAPLQPLSGAEISFLKKSALPVVAELCKDLLLAYRQKTNGSLSKAKVASRQLQRA